MSSSNSATSWARITTHYKLYEQVLLLHRTPAPFRFRDQQQTSHKATRPETTALTYGPEILSSLPSYQNPPARMGPRFSHRTSAQQQHHQPSLPGVFTGIYWQPCSTSAISCRQNADLLSARSQTVNTVKRGEKGARDHPHLGSFQSAGHKTLKYTAHRK